jgi:K+/H+ antiporter YhaU regulatory subunit KhtT
VKLDSEPKTQRVKRLGQDSKVKKREKKEIGVSEISKFVDKKEEAAVLTLAGCQKETESGGEDSWEDITTSGNDSACEELSPHSNTDSILDVTSTKVKSEVPENTGEMSPNPEIKSKMLQIGEFKSEVLQHTVEKPEVLQNTKVKVGMFQNAEVQPEMLHNPELKPDVLQDTEMKPDVLQDTEVRSGVLQNTEMRSEVLQNTEMISEVLQNTDMKSDILQNIAGRTGVLQNTEMRSEVIQNTDVKSDVLQNTEGRSEVLQNTEVRSEVLQNTEVRSETLQTVGSVLNNDADDSTEVTQVIVNENLPDAVIQDILEKRCTSVGSTEYAQLRDISEICFEKSLSDTLAETKAETVNESTELTEVEDISLVTECKGERLESEIKIEPEKRCRQNEQPGKVDVTETSGSAAANSLPEEKEGPV